MTDSVAVVIPSRNQSETVRRCLDAITLQTVAPMDVIVVDSSDNETADIIRSDYPDVRLVRRASPTTAGEARNIGVAATDADVVSFVDTDCVADPKWIESVISALGSTRAAGVVGSVKGPRPESWVARLDRSMQFSGFEATRQGRWVGIGPGCNMTLRRNLLEDVGGFPSIQRAQDTVLCRRYVERHGSLWFEPAATVTHLSPDDLDLVLRRQQNQGGGLVQSRTLDPGLHGSAVLRRPALLWPLAAARCVTIAVRLVLHDRRLLATWVRHPRSVVRCFTAWTSGVRNGIRKHGADHSG